MPSPTADADRGGRGKKSIDVDDCNLAVDMGIEERLQILDATKRMRLVHKIDTRL